MYRFTAEFKKKKILHSEPQSLKHFKKSNNVGNDRMYFKSFCQTIGSRVGSNLYCLLTVITYLMYHTQITDSYNEK